MTRWVEIEDVILEPGQRAPQVPEDTRRVPLEFRLKGFLDKDRRASVSVYHAQKRGYPGVIAATSGNYGAAVASQACHSPRGPTGLMCRAMQRGRYVTWTDSSR